MIKDDNEKIGFFEGLKKLFSNKNYVLLFVTFNCIYGIYSCIGAIIGTLTAPYGYSVSDNSILCMATLLSGVIAAFFLGSLLDKYHIYTRLLNIICVIFILSLCISYFTIPFGNVVL